MQISIILKKDSLDFKGEFLAAHNRTKWLLTKFPGVKVQVYLLSEYDGFFTRLIKRKIPRKQVRSLTFDGIEYHYLWHKSSLIDSIVSRFNLPRTFTLSAIKAKSNEIGQADLLIAHSFYAGYLALQLKQKYGTPYTVTWHGSDIHTAPFSNKSVYDTTKQIIVNADQNFFVSKKLMEVSDQICVSGRKQVLYNGVNTSVFKPISTEDIDVVKKANNISSDTKCVAFIGNLYPVKNAGLLPDIFVAIKKKYLDKICFHIIGDGFLRKYMEKRAEELGIEIRFWGNMAPENIPNIINCMDLVVLPSKNEGLPLITLETIACGVTIIGSDVGGIAEAIGKENTIELGENFVDKFSDLACHKLQKAKRPILDKKFLWETSAQIETEIIDKILKE